DVRPLWGCGRTREYRQDARAIAFVTDPPEHIQREPHRLPRAIDPATRPWLHDAGGQMGEVREAGAVPGSRQVADLREEPSLVLPAENLGRGQVECTGAEHAEEVLDVSRRAPAGEFLEDRTLHAAITEVTDRLEKLATRCGEVGRSGGNRPLRPLRLDRSERPCDSGVATAQLQPDRILFAH